MGKIETDFILQELIPRKGKEKGIHSFELAQLFGLGERTTRSIVSDLRKLGYPICSGVNGYYWADSTEDQKRTINHLKARAFDMLRTVSIQERIPAGELAGQLTLALEGGNHDQAAL